MRRPCGRPSRANCARCPPNSVARSPTTRAKQCASTASLPGRRRCASILPTHSVPGSGARTRTPIACCANSSPRGPGLISSRAPRSNGCKRCSTTGPAKFSTGTAPLMPSTNCCTRTLNAHQQRIAEIQQALRAVPGLDGWLFYDFRCSDPLAYRVLRLDSTRHVTRRWYYWIPAQGQLAKLVHRIESHTLDELPGETVLYASWDEQRTSLARILKKVKQVAMQYSPLNAIPYISRVDAGTIELIRSFGVEVVTSADLVQRFEAVWNDHQLDSHRDAAAKLRRIVDESFAHVGASVSAQTPLTEYGLHQFILSPMKSHGLITSSPPIAAVNPHSADHPYTPGTNGSYRHGAG